MPVVGVTRVLEEPGYKPNGPYENGPKEARKWIVRARVAPLVGVEAILGALAKADLPVSATPVHEEQTVHVEVPGRGLVASELVDLERKGSTFDSDHEYLVGPVTTQALRALAQAVDVVHHIPYEVAANTGVDAVAPDLEAQLRGTSHNPVNCQWLDLPALEPTPVAPLAGQAA